MTTIAWDSRYLVADTRTVTEHFMPEHLKLSETDIKVLKEDIDADRWIYANSYFETKDGQQKIFLPNPRKPLFYRGEKIRAIGVSGDIDFFPVLNNLPAQSDLGDYRGFMQQVEAESGMFIVVTVKQVHQVHRGNSPDEKTTTQIITAMDPSLFMCIGSGMIDSFNHKPMSMNAWVFCNIAAIMNMTSGGSFDVWDSKTGILQRKAPLPFAETVKHLGEYFALKTLDTRIGVKLMPGLSSKEAAKAAGPVVDMLLKKEFEDGQKRDKDRQYKLAKLLSLADPQKICIELAREYTALQEKNGDLPTTDKKTQETKDAVRIPAEPKAKHPRPRAVKRPKAKSVAREKKATATPVPRK